MQAKDEKMKAEVVELQDKYNKQSSKIFKVQPNVVPDELSEEATKDLTNWERRSQVQDTLHKKIVDYIQKLFGLQRDSNGNNRPSQKLHDISLDYMHNLYEMYPNMRLHCELIAECLNLLCFIVTHPDLMQVFKPRQREFYNSLPTQQDHEDNERFDRSCLKTPLDYFIVEVKSKIICMIFKFYQRDETIIQQQAKKSLKALLEVEHSPNEALPNIILKEVIRPYLTQISLRQSNEQNYQHLSKLIKILYTCFNEQLKFLLTSTLKQL